MATRAVVPGQFTTFGELLRYLRERAELTQRELALQVGYHYSYLSRVERGERTPDEATVLARFIPALYLEDEPAWAARLVELAAGGRGKTAAAADSPLPSAAARAFPAPPAGPAGSRLPAPASAFIGREREVERLAALLAGPEVRLVTLTGPPGIGKTRLALQSAGELAGAFEDGIDFVDLTALHDPLLLVPHLAQALGLSAPDGGATEAALLEALRGGSRLLILDNFEQIIRAAPVVSRLLGAAPGLKVLVTSRENLRLDGEHEFRVPALAVKEEEGAPAVRLFIQRARAVRPSFAPTPEDAAEIARLCDRLDGLPLAIELAAARVNLFAPAAMLDRLDRRLGWLTGGRRDGPDWRRTLEGAIDWSYQLLPDEEKELFAGLAAFAGGGSLTAVEIVCGGDLDTLAALGEKSLIVLHPARAAGSDLRFSWLESLREFAAAALAARPEVRRARLAAHAAFYRELAENTAGAFVRSRSSGWLEQLDLEMENLRAALAWALETEDADLAVALCARLGDYWDIRGRFEEGRGWLAAALALGGLEPSAKLGRAFSAAAWLARRQNDMAEAIAWYRRSIETWLALGDETARANALMDLGGLMSQQDAPGRERAAHFREALAIYRSLDDRRGIANALNQLGIFAYSEGQFREAFGYFEEVFSMHRAAGDRIALSGSMNNLGLAAYAFGEYEAARDWHLQALELREELGFEGRIGQSLTNLALSLLRLGEVEEAEARARLSLRTGLKLKLKMGAVEAIEALGAAAAIRGRVERAARLFGAAEALRGRIGAERDRIQQSDQDWALSLPGELVDTAEWRAAWEAGARLSLEQAAEYALGNG